MNSCTEIDKYPLHSTEQDSILILTASSEDRCLGFINKIDEGYAIENTFIIEYEHPSPKRDRNIAIMEKRLKNCGNVKRIKTDETAVFPKIPAIVNEVCKACVTGKVPTITLDISTMIKWHLLLLLKAFHQKELLSYVRLIYTEPEDYFLDLMQPLSFGNKGTFPIPFFQGNFSFSRETCLFLMLGYEGQRSLTIFDSMDPERCFLLIPRPAYRKEWEGRTESMNQEVINLVGHNNLRYIDARNPILVKEQIQNIVTQENVSRYNCVFAPLGPKPQLIGLFDYYVENPKHTNLVYVSPLRHNEIYSKRIGPSWIVKERTA